MKKSSEPISKTIHVKVNSEIYDYIGKFGMPKGTAFKCIVNYIKLNNIPISEVIGTTVKHYRGIR